MKNTILIIIITLFVGGFIFYKVSGGEKQVALIGVDTELIELGEVSMADGVAKVQFNLTNTGTRNLKINGLQTSCMCTTAKMIINGEGSPIFGMHGGPSWRGEIVAGASAILEVHYDPNAHGPDATGPFERLILVKSNADNNDELSVKIRGVVVKEKSQDNQVQGLSLYISQKEYDFGIIKQSDGIVSTEFEVINNGTEKVVIDSLPTSCACTSAEIDNKEINQGEKAIVTVYFDANLHEEPEGKFFKTISLVSNIEPAPELKIFVEMDYDLGMDKLKLKEHND